jgi:chemotaxis signal transduction protein
MQEGTASETFILLELAGTTYAIRSNFVQQVMMIEHVTPVPNAISVVEGVVHARGRVVPALNLRVRFGFEKVPFDLRSRLIIVSVDGRVIGLLVDYRSSSGRDHWADRQVPGRRCVFKGSPDSDIEIGSGH